MADRLKKSIAFYCCSNGYGHFRRVVDIATILKEEFDIEIYCTVEQFEKFQQPEDVVFVVSHKENINWKRALNGEREKVIDNYFDWVQDYGQSTENYDIVISDNMPGILGYRPDALLLGSFFWKDVFLSSFGENRLTTFDSMLIEKYKPIIITNKYVETQSVKDYSNKIQYGFGCNIVSERSATVNTNLINNSSLKYLDTYREFIDNLELDLVDDFTITENAIMFARPGVGTITHCVENSIPLVALYDKNDSKEILELAQVVEDLQLGFKQDVMKPFNEYDYNLWTTNTQLLEKPMLEDNAYSKIADYIRNYV